MWKQTHGAQLKWTWLCPIISDQLAKSQRTLRVHVNRKKNSSIELKTQHYNILKCLAHVKLRAGGIKKTVTRHKINFIAS